MLKQALQSYFDSVYPDAKIEDEHTLKGPVYIRFELGAELDNGTSQRVKQATDRALAIFEDTFQDPTNEVFVLIYEYQDGNFHKASNDYLHKQFPTAYFAKFYNQKESAIQESDIRIIIGKLPINAINIQNILNGIANTEMGFKPSIDQRIFFFDPKTDRAFQMYDDRGCFVWSDNADKIRTIYIKRQDWIVKYHKPEIDAFFNL